jgi:ketosteroid isomerase-like protein
VSVEENMALARRFMEARVKGDVDAVDEMLAPDFVNHNKLVPGQVPDREGQKYGRQPNSLRPSPTSAYTSRTR